MSLVTSWKAPRSAWIDVSIHPDDYRDGTDSYFERCGMVAGVELPRYVAHVALRERVVLEDHGIFGKRVADRLVARRRRTFRGETAQQCAEVWAQDVAHAWRARGVMPDRRGVIPPAPVEPERKRTACYCDSTFHPEGCM